MTHLKDAYGAARVTPYIHGAPSQDGSAEGIKQQAQSNRSGSEDVRRARQIAKLASGWHRVSAGLSIQFPADQGGIFLDWQPRPPSRREWKHCIGAYRAARSLFLKDLLEIRGGPLLWSDVDGPMLVMADGRTVNAHA